MALMFPHQPDVQLENAPLAEVICQVRFPPILRILNEEPSEFQERVRHRFPELQFEQGLVVTLSVPPTSGPPAVDAPPRVYRFHNLADQTTTSLALDFFAVATQAYTHWRNFAADLALAAGAVQAIYAPAYATRIGLRYVNRFTPAGTGRQSLDDVLALLRPELSSLYRTDAWSEPGGLVTQLTLPDDSGTLIIRSACGRAEGEPFFVLDFDYFEEGPLPLEGLIERCDRYHRTIYNAFRWSLRPASLHVFRPLAAQE
jgi:uncharacterized protein (TIGR04255 family)